MLNSRIVSVVLIAAMLMGAPVAWAADASARAASGPQVTTSAAPLSAAEMARYSQLQSAAAEQGLLQQKGGADETTWIVVGTIGLLVIIGGVIAATQV